MSSLSKMFVTRGSSADNAAGKTKVAAIIATARIRALENPAGNLLLRIMWSPP
jgi:hypothetical protein